MLVNQIIILVYKKKLGRNFTMNTPSASPTAPVSSRRLHAHVKSMILAALFAALTAVGAFIQIPLGFTSITLQVLFSCLAGVLLGAKWGAISQTVYVALGLVGLPVFTQGGGLGYLAKPSMGFLFGLILLSWLAGLLTRADCSPFRVALACVAGDLAMYAVALPYMYLVLNLYMGAGKSALDVVRGGMLIFLPGDAVKIAVTALVSRPLLKAVKRA